MGILKSLLLRWTDPIVIVSGLPRSGTSMLMKMLEAGGIEPFTDRLRAPDEDNPKGYFEYEPVKRLHEMADKSWLLQARGRSLKVISYLLPSLPPDHRYQILFMNRHLDEVAASQEKMLERQAAQLEQSPEQVREMLEHQLWRARYWMKRQGNVTVLELAYAEILKEPLASARRIQEFLGRDLDTDGMATVVDKTLYRNRVED